MDIICNFGVILVFISFITGLSSFSEGSQEFCSEEVFEASCGEDQVIAMQEAQYGRMEIGKCVKSNIGGFLGCQTSVMKTMDEKCSGRRQCLTPVSELERTEENPCSRELKVYLKADFTCIRVMSRTDMCTTSGSLQLKEETTTLSSRQLVASACFTPRSDWTRRVQASNGQQITITLIDFENEEPLTSRICREYGHVTDAHTQQSEMICGRGERERRLLTSNSNVVNLIIKQADSTPNFALRFEVLGCADIRTSSNSWSERDGNTLTVGCHFSKQTWNLECVGNRWQGTVGNCTKEGARPALAKPSVNEPKTSQFSTDIAVALIACVAILICVVVIAVGVNCWKRHTLKNYTLRMQREAIQQALKYQENPESEYMMPDYRPKENDEGVDALYDFCYMPSTSKVNQPALKPNNLNTVRTISMPPKMNNATAVRFKTATPKLYLPTDPNV